MKPVFLVIQYLLKTVFEDSLNRVLLGSYPLALEQGRLDIFLGLGQSLLVFIDQRVALGLLELHESLYLVNYVFL